MGNQRCNWPIIYFGQTPAPAPHIAPCLQFQLLYQGEQKSGGITRQQPVVCCCGGEMSPHFFAANSYVEKNISFQQQKQTTEQIPKKRHLLPAPASLRLLLCTATTAILPSLLLEPAAREVQSKRGGEGRGGTEDRRVKHPLGPFWNPSP